MPRLSLHQRFLVAPVVGLIIVLALTASFLWQSENQNNLIDDISSADLTTLGLYTELFTDLSRYHQELYELFNSAGQSVDEGVLYDQGVVIMDNIFVITRKMEHLLTDDHLRGSLESEGIRQAKAFTWENCARETLAVYQRLLPGN